MSQGDFLEIERKFLIHDLPPGYDDHPSEIIAQTYLSRPGYFPVLRVRRYGPSYWLTVKKREKENPLICHEVEIPIDRDRFEKLREMGEGRHITKRRYRIPLEGLTAELDIFEDNLAGLILAEVEFENPDAARAFSPPPWFGREVTDEPGYSNNYLASNGLP